MRTILHAKFNAHVVKLSSTSDKVTRVSPSPGLRDSSVEEFEAALTKARTSWRAERLLFTVAASRGVGRNFVGGHELARPLTHWHDVRIRGSGRFRSLSL